MTDEGDYPEVLEHYVDAIASEAPVTGGKTGLGPTPKAPSNSLLQGASSAEHGSFRVAASVSKYGSFE
jgi:hypothetical protein